MCRFIAYLGEPILLDDILYKPTNSLIQQSRAARELLVPVNGDGVGIGWYHPEISNIPALFKSVQPAWNDINLLDISSHTQSSCFVGHVRAATAGGVTQFNCHPFRYDRYLMLHNGSIVEFETIKRRIRAKLSDDAYDWIKGQTDTEHFYAVFLDRLYKQTQPFGVDAIVAALQEAVHFIEKLQAKYNNGAQAFFNLVVTDGQIAVALRYVSQLSEEPRSLHYSYGSRYEFKDGYCHMFPTEKRNGAVIIASEKLNNFSSEWHDVPPNHFLLVDENLDVSMQPVV